MDEAVVTAAIMRARLTPQKNSRLERIHSDHIAWLKKKEEIESLALRTFD